jgi:hypothetical protein
VATKPEPTVKVVSAQMEVRACTCKHEFQDRQYGKGTRAHTVNTKNKKVTCTVCGAQKPL